MGTIPEVTAAPATVKVGNREYTLHELTWNDIGEFEQWMRMSVLSTAADAAEQLAARPLPGDTLADYTSATQGRERLIEMLLDSGHRRAEALWFGSPEIAGYKTSPEGIVRLVHLSMRPTPQPIDADGNLAHVAVLTRAQVGCILAPKPAFDAIMAAFFQANESIFGKGSGGRFRQEAAKRPGPATSPADSAGGDGGSVAAGKGENEGA